MLFLSLIKQYRVVPSFFFVTTKNLCSLRRKQLQIQRPFSSQLRSEPRQGGRSKKDPKAQSIMILLKESKLFGEKPQNKDFKEAFRTQAIGLSKIFLHGKKNVSAAANAKAPRALKAKYGHTMPWLSGQEKHMGICIRQKE